MEGLDLATIHIAATISDVGWDNNTPVGGATAVCISSSNPTGMEHYLTYSWLYSTNCLQFDASCFSITKMAEALTLHYYTHPPLAHLFLFCSDYSAFLAVTNPRSWSAQTAALLFHSSLTSFVTTHPHTRITLVWTPDDPLLHPQCYVTAGTFTRRESGD